MVLKCTFVSYLLLVDNEVHSVYLRVWKYGQDVKLKFILIQYMESSS